MGNAASEDPACVISDRAARIWRDVLGPAASEEATFFELAGQSISAIRILARLEDELNIRLDASVLFDDPDLATYLRAVLAAAGSRPVGP